VVDTVGIKVAPFSTVDALGTPLSKALHVAERCGEAAAAIQRKHGAVELGQYPLRTPRYRPRHHQEGIAGRVPDDLQFSRRHGRSDHLIGEWPEAASAREPALFGHGRHDSHGAHSGFLNR
jgi:hypothetical protein